ncbi:ImmA/IrrE family metallo-endopeptidase [Paracoccus cavernae]|uniref:ImmA/IrrE family metallo-endopeptidase n=1 Tax=Paracoccus cavernae TaxID=1571207 RepID=A0ABT8D574_9RHOB|nr:ImmA/IrrE family metallo-endopeptidase [Paracoccus cavernae]
MVEERAARPRWQLAAETANNLTGKLKSPPVPVYQIAEQSGVDVVFADFGPHAATVAGFCDFENAKLYVNRDDRSERQQFTIAHELGHWLLHKELFLTDPARYPVLPRFAHPDRDNVYEKEANCFAANLLVPERLLAPIKKAPVQDLARAFGVSPTMMGYRIRNV